MSGSTVSEALHYRLAYANHTFHHLPSLLSWALEKRRLKVWWNGRLSDVMWFRWVGLSFLREALAKHSSPIVFSRLIFHNTKLPPSLA
jgi:hypothetical protein